MIRQLKDRIKNWWNIWVFVIGFPLGLVFLFFFWWYLLQLWPHLVWVILVSIVFLYGAIILSISIVVAISENNQFIAAFLVLLVGVVIAVLGYYFAHGSFPFKVAQFANDFYANVSSELIGLVIAFLTFAALQDRLHWRNYQREKQSQEIVPASTPSPASEQANNEDTSQFRRQNSSLRGVASLASILLGLLLGIIIGQNWRGSSNKK
jgi:uncharacterized membrane protein YccC